MKCPFTWDEADLTMRQALLSTFLIVTHLTLNNNLDMGVAISFTGKPDTEIM